jgi:hypothetical protein
MPAYRINVVRLDGCLFRARDIECADDEEAVAKAMQAANGYAVEIWDQKRLVARAPMASILPFIRTKTDFDDQATRIMGAAFDAAWAELRATGQTTIAREVVAKRIIALAMKGERDPARLRAAALVLTEPR